MEYTTAQATPPAPPTAQDLALPGFTVGAVVAAVLGFGFKFLFDQAIQGWERRFAELEKDLAQQTVPPKQVDILERRLENLGGALQDTQKLFQETQKDLIKLRGELSTDYVRREDWIRFSSTLEAKMDGLNRKIDDRFETLFHQRREP